MRLMKRNWERQYLQRKALERQQQHTTKKYCEAVSTTKQRSPKEWCVTQCSPSTEKFRFIYLTLCCYFYPCCIDHFKYILLKVVQVHYKYRCNFLKGSQSFNATCNTGQCLTSSCQTLFCPFSVLWSSLSDISTTPKNFSDVLRFSRYVYQLDYKLLMQE